MTGRVDYFIRLSIVLLIKVISVKEFFEALFFLSQKKAANWLLL